MQNVPDEGVDLDSVDVIEFLQGLLNLGLVGLDVDDENECVVLLNLLHCAFGVERVHNNLVLVKTGRMGNRLPRVLWCSGDLERLRAMEAGREPSLALRVGVDLKSPQHAVSSVGVAFRGGPRGEKSIKNLHPSRRPSPHPWLAWSPWMPWRHLYLIASAIAL